jgi:hypothetical protein
VSDDFQDLLRALVEDGARFLIVGAYAVGAHGLPRATADIDIWISADQENSKRVHRALARFGAPIENLSPNDLTKPDLIYQIGVPPYRIDIITKITGVVFESAWPNRLELPIEGVNVPVIGRDDLLKNKRAAGRPKDIIDVQALERFPRS